MTEVDKFTIDRNGREYVAHVHVDESPQNPREDYAHSATQFYVAQPGWRIVDVDELDGDAGNALHHFIEKYGSQESDDIERAFSKWRAITASSVVLITGGDNGYVQGAYHVWFALVDTDVLQRDGYGATAAEVAKAEADEYAAYAFGDVYGVVVTLNDNEIDALWGIIDRQGSYVREVADNMVTMHEEWLQSQASFAGAGFIGVI